MNIHDIEKAFSSKDKSQIDTALAALTTLELTPQQKGALLMNFITMYADFTNSVNKHYRDSLVDAIKHVKQLKSLDNKIGDQEKISKLESELNA